MKKFVFAILILAFSSLLLADDISISNYKNIRGMGMGGAYFTPSPDETALLYNPAMLNFIEDHKFSLLSISAGMNDQGNDVWKVFNEEILKDINDGTFDKMSDSAKLDYLKSKQAKINNKSMNAYAGNFTGFVGHNFGLGLFSYMNINNLALVKPVNPEVTIDASAVLANAPIGIATNFGPFSLGASIRYINYIRLNSSLTSNKLIDAKNVSGDKAAFALLKAQKNEGFGLNIGAAYTNDYFRLGLGLQDAYTSIDTWEDNEELDSATGQPTKSGKYETYYLGNNKAMPNLRLSLACEPTDWLSLSGELENLLSKDLNEDGSKDDNFYKKIHLGSEITIFKGSYLLGNIKVRTGLNQGYFTYGLGMHLLWIAQLEYADYTEETGPHLGMKPNHIKSLAATIRF